MVVSNPRPSQRFFKPTKILHRLPILLRVNLSNYQMVWVTKIWISLPRRPGLCAIGTAKSIGDDLTALTTDHHKVLMKLWGHGV